jgi:diketogulonate reductase-like aldo/keto reductase
MNDVLDKIKADDQTIMPGVSTTGGLDSVGVSRLCGAAQAALVESFCQGVKILDLACEYGISESCVKRTLHRSGVGRRQRY